MTSSKKDSSELLNKQEIKSESKRQRKERKDLSSGPISSRVPTERSGYHQHVVCDKDGRLQRALDDLAYDYRTDKDGKPITFTGGNNETFFVLECPEDVWEEEQRKRIAKAAEGIEALKRKRSFGKNNMQFEGEAVMTRGSMDIRDDSHFRGD